MPSGSSSASRSALRHAANTSATRVFSSVPRHRPAIRLRPTRTRQCDPFTKAGKCSVTEGTGRGSDRRASDCAASRTRALPGAPDGRAPRARWPGRAARQAARLGRSVHGKVESGGLGLRNGPATPAPSGASPVHLGAVEHPLSRCLFRSNGTGASSGADVQTTSRCEPQPHQSRKPRPFSHRTGAFCSPRQPASSVRWVGGTELSACTVASIDRLGGHPSRARWYSSVPCALPEQASDRARPDTMAKPERSGQSEVQPPGEDTSTCACLRASMSMSSRTIGCEPR